MRILGRPLTQGLSVQISILGPILARTEQRFSLHCMSNLMTCQIIMRDAEATLALKDRKKKKWKRLMALDLKLSVLDDRYWVVFSTGCLLQASS